MTDTKLNSLVLLRDPIVDSLDYMYGEKDGAAAMAVPAGGGGGGLLTASLSLTSADILGLNTSPITFLEGVPGKTIVPVVAFLTYTHVTTDYSVAGGLGLYYNNTGDIHDIDDNGSRAVIDVKAILDAGGSDNVSLYEPVAPGGKAVGNVITENIPLVALCRDRQPNGRQQHDNARFVVRAEMTASVSTPADLANLFRTVTNDLVMFIFP